MHPLLRYKKDCERNYEMGRKYDKYTFSVIPEVHMGISENVFLMMQPVEMYLL